MQAFVVVVALLAVAALGWLLSWVARRILRRHGVPTDEGDVTGGRAPGDRAAVKDRTDHCERPDGQ
jgi:hypothetical protein